MATRKAPPTNKNTGRPVGDTRRRHLDKVKAGAKSKTRAARTKRAAAVRSSRTR